MGTTYAASTSGSQLVMTRTTPRLPTRKTRAVDEAKTCAALSVLLHLFTRLLVLVWLLMPLRFSRRSFQVHGPAISSDPFCLTAHAISFSRRVIFGDKL
jgi:hypothetical protein